MKPTTHTCRRRLTALDRPRRDISASLHQPEAMQIYNSIHHWICERQLTVGCHQTVSWCHIHECPAELGTCEQCADIAERQLIEVSNTIAFNNAMELIRRNRESQRRHREKQREQRRLKGTRGYMKGPPITLPTTEAWDEFYWDLQETHA